MNVVISQSDSIQQAEILIRNGTLHQITVKVFPIGAIFSGYWTLNDFQQRYSLRRSRPEAPVPLWQDPRYITGGEKTILSGDHAVIDFDDGNYYSLPSGKIIGGVSYGLWKFEFYYTPDGPSNVDLIAECYIDYRDFNRGVSGLDPNIDIKLDLVRKPNSNVDSLLFHFVGGSGDTVNISDNRIENKIIKSWHKVGRIKIIGNDTIRDPIISGSPNKGLFRTRSIEFGSYPIDATLYGAIAHLKTSNIEMNLQVDSNGTKITSGDSLNFKDAALTISSGKTFTLENNSHLTFDGVNSFLDAKPGSTIILGDNATIEFKNNANIKANGVTFNSTNSNTVWKGIKLVNAGIQTKIENCTFNNVKTAVSINNTIAANAANNIIIRKNIFNISAEKGKGIEAKDVFKLQADSNTFNFSNTDATVGIYFRNSISTGPPGEGSGPPVYYSLNFINNKFNNSCFVPMILSCTAADRAPVYVYNNKFTGNNIYSIAGYKITGA